MLVVVRLRYGVRTKAHVERRLQDGKTKREAMRCLTRCVARTIYHTLGTDPRSRTTSAARA